MQHAAVAIAAAHRINFVAALGGDPADDEILRSGAVFIILIDVDIVLIPAAGDIQAMTATEIDDAVDLAADDVRVF